MALERESRQVRNGDLGLLVDLPSKPCASRVLNSQFPKSRSYAHQRTFLISRLTRSQAPWFKRCPTLSAVVSLFRRHFLCPFAQAPSERYSNPGVIALDDLRVIGVIDLTARCELPDR